MKGYISSVIRISRTVISFFFNRFVVLIIIIIFLLWHTNFQISAAYQWDIKFKIYKNHTSLFCLLPGDCVAYYKIIIPWNKFDNKFFTTFALIIVCQVYFFYIIGISCMKNIKIYVTTRVRLNKNTQLCKWAFLRISKMHVKKYF